MTGTRRADAARVAFAATLVVLGAHALVTRSIAGVWGPVPAFVPAQATLPWLIGVVVAACGAGLLWRRTSRAGCTRWRWSRSASRTCRLRRDDAKGACQELKSKALPMGLLRNARQCRSLAADGVGYDGRYARRKVRIQAALVLRDPA